MFGPRRGREYQQCARNLSNMRATLFSFEIVCTGVALPRSSATSNLLSAKAIETTRSALYSGGFNPRNSSIRMRRRALVVRSISSCRRRANDFIEWSSVSSSNRLSTHVSAHDRTVWTTPMSIHHRPYCPFIALHVARVRLLSVVSFSKIWAPTKRHTISRCCRSVSAATQTLVWGHREIVNGLAASSRTLPMNIAANGIALAVRNK
jgi:hypothetical protein